MLKVQQWRPSIPVAAQWRKQCQVHGGWGWSPCWNICSGWEGAEGLAGQVWALQARGLSWAAGAALEHMDLDKAAVTQLCPEGHTNFGILVADTSLAEGHSRRNCSQFVYMGCLTAWNPLSFSHFSAKTLSVCRVIFWTPAKILVLSVLKSRKLSSRKCHIQNNLLIVHKWCMGCLLAVLSQLSLASLWNVLAAPVELHKSQNLCI